MTVFIHDKIAPQKKEIAQFLLQNCARLLKIDIELKPSLVE